jgi:hypothetical protein
VKTAELDALFPDRVWTYARGEHAASTLIPATVTHLARAALGLPTEDVPRDAMLAAISETLRTNRWGEFVSPNWLGFMALCSAYLGDWDLVARCTGGKMLGTTVKTKTFNLDARGLARHLAAAARSKLPAIKVAAAMNAMRDQFMQGTLVPDARVAPIAAGLFVRDLVIPSDDVVAVTRRWLDGEELELEPQTATVRAVADGEDPRVVIFERYAAELGDDFGIDREVGAVPAMDEWSRDVARERADLDDLAIRAFVARRPLFSRWELTIDPGIAGWLGAEPTRAIEQRFLDQKLLHYGGQLAHVRGFEDIAMALAVGNHEAVIRSTGRDMTAFKPHRFFKDDGRKLLRYLATAIAQGGTVADVEPAWLDFLARRSPATTPRIEAGPLRWKQLLSIQAAITHVLGKGPRGEAGAALRRAIAAAR